MEIEFEYEDKNFKTYLVNVTGNAFGGNYEPTHCEIESIRVYSILDDGDIGEEITKTLANEIYNQIEKEAAENLITSWEEATND